MKTIKPLIFPFLIFWLTLTTQAQTLQNQAKNNFNIGPSQRIAFEYFHVSQSQGTPTLYWRTIQPGYQLYHTYQGKSIDQTPTKYFPCVLAYTLSADLTITTATTTLIRPDNSPLDTYTAYLAEPRQYMGTQATLPTEETALPTNQAAYRATKTTQTYTWSPSPDKTNPGLIYQTHRTTTNYQTYWHNWNTSTDHDSPQHYPLPTLPEAKPSEPQHIGTTQKGETIFTSYSTPTNDPAYVPYTRIQYYLKAENQPIRAAAAYTFPYPRTFAACATTSTFIYTIWQNKTNTPAKTQDPIRNSQYILTTTPNGEQPSHTTYNPPCKDKTPILEYTHTRGDTLHIWYSSNDIPLILATLTPTATVTTLAITRDTLKKHLSRQANLRWGPYSSWRFAPRKHYNLPAGETLVEVYGLYYTTNDIPGKGPAIPITGWFNSVEGNLWIHLTAAGTIRSIYFLPPRQFSNHRSPNYHVIPLAHPGTTRRFLILQPSAFLQSDTTLTLQSTFPPSYGIINNTTSEVPAYTSSQFYRPILAEINTQEQTITITDNKNPTLHIEHPDHTQWRYPYLYIAGIDYSPSMYTAPHTPTTTRKHHIQKWKWE